MGMVVSAGKWEADYFQGEMRGRQLTGSQFWCTLRQSMRGIQQGRWFLLYKLNIMSMRRILELKDSYDNIQRANYPSNIKKHLMESLADQLRETEKMMAANNQLSINSCIRKEETITNFTANSQITYNSCLLLEQSNCSSPLQLASQIGFEELELKIIEKQKMKCFLNEEIETLEDDFFEREKILLTKKEYSEELDKLIAKKSYEISKKSCRKSGSALEDDRKGFSARLKSFFKM